MSKAWGLGAAALGVVAVVAVQLPTAAAQPTPPGFPDLSSYTDVSSAHDVSVYYTLATFTGPGGLQCAMWSSLGDTSASCFGHIPGVDHPVNRVYANDYESRFSQDTDAPAKDKLDGKPLASGEKIVLGAGGTLMQGDQITCGVHDTTIACVLVNGFSNNHGDATAKRTGFVLNEKGSWTF
jgi:hypothetical protein